MPASNDRKALLALFDRFVNAEIGGGAFVRRFLRLWRERRDARLVQTPNRDAALLQAELIAKKMTPEDFSRRWNALWGYRSENDVTFDEMVTGSSRRATPSPRGRRT